MTTLLIVDDEPNLRRLLGMVLREEGHWVVEAASSRRLAARCTTTTWTSSSRISGSGTATVSRSRTASRAADPAVPVVFLTAYATVAADAQGAFDVVAKPFDPEWPRSGGPSSTRASSARTCACARRSVASEMT